MARSGPLVTAVVVLVGLAGFLAVNTAGGLVKTSEGTAVPTATETSGQPPPTSPPPTSQPPASQPPTSQASAQPTTAAPTFPAEVVYAGKANTGRLAIAVAVKGEQAAAYLCDGRNIEAWLRGTAAQGKVALSSKDGSSRLTATLDGQNLTGTTSTGGREYPFTIGVAKPPAGLYRGADGSTTIGWIVLPDGTQVGIATTGGSSEAAPELNTQDGAVTMNGRQIDAEKVAGDTNFG